MIKIDIQPHRRYEFRHDFNIDWEGIYNWDENAVRDYENLTDNYYCFTLDFFEHSTVSFSLVIDRVDLGYYEFDRARNVGIIWVKNDGITYEQAKVLARAELEDYNNYLNWWDEDE